MLINESSGLFAVKPPGSEIDQIAQQKLAHWLMASMYMYSAIKDECENHFEDALSVLKIAENHVNDIKKMKNSGTRASNGQVAVQEVRNNLKVNRALIAIHLSRSRLHRLLFAREEPFSVKNHCQNTLSEDLLRD